MRPARTRPPAAAAALPTPNPHEPLLHAAVRGLRPRQWIKNVLVFAAPLAAAQLFHPDVLVRTLLAFVVFCAVASGIYLINDALDVEEDRRHPKKRFRPIASGALPINVAWGMATVLLLVGLVVSYLVSPALAVTMAVYISVQIAYSMGLKHQAVLDLAVVAAGFLLRMIAGGAASHLPISQWFLLVASFGSLFMVAGKRYSELHSVGREAETRPSLKNYSDSYLRFVWSISAGCSITFYALWSFQAEPTRSGAFAAISIAPFTLALFRYAVDIDRGLAGSPEDIVLGDRVLQVLGLIWLVLLTLAVFGVGHRG